mmetsp:Transcript_51356/g.81501  ORF Transcript_51356/g.81501 Transcript_51356/m.81501 type:complete len:89 (+) Transcript_51356:373-639(+)
MVAQAAQASGEIARAGTRIAEQGPDITTVNSACQVEGLRSPDIRVCAISSRLFRLVLVTIYASSHSGACRRISQESQVPEKHALLYLS